MKPKNFFLLVLMLHLIGSVPVFSADFSLIWTHDSRYVVDGMDFAGKDDVALDLFGLSFQEKKFGSFVYAAITEDYFEWGLDLNYTFSFKWADWKTTFFPFGWAVPGETYWGFMLINELTVNNSVAPIIAKHSYAHLLDLKELNGHYFYLGTNKNVFGFDCQAGVNYNQHFFTGGGKGWGGIFGISKSIELNEKVFLDLYFKYYVNANLVNEDEQVVGATIAIKL